MGCHQARFQRKYVVCFGADLAARNQLTLAYFCSLTSVERCSACKPKLTQTAGSLTSSAAQNHPSPSPISPPPHLRCQDSKMLSAGRPNPTPARNTYCSMFHPCSPSFLHLCSSSSFLHGHSTHLVGCHSSSLSQRLSIALP